MKLLVCLLLSCVYRIHALQYGYNKSSVVLRSANGRIRGTRDVMDEDFIIGGLFPIHSEAGPGRCGDFRLQGGLERMEAMLFALDLINSDATLLPNITLGYDIRDTCYLENVGLDEAYDLITTGSQLDITSCQATDSSILGIVGAAASRVSVPVAGLCRLLITPQVSYSSTSETLSNRENYNFFYRTISSDTLQARAMIDLMLHFNWTYISTIHTRNAYGQPGIDEVHALAAEHGICIDLTEGIDDDFTDREYQILTNKLINSQANVVVVFTAQKNAEDLLSRVHNISSSRHRFTWIASNAWATSHVVYQFNETAAGLFGITPVRQHLDDFHAYISQLTTKSNVRNPWFPAFYSAYVDSQRGDSASLCDENANLTCLSSYQQGATVPSVIDAVYTFAHALQNFLSENCETPTSWYNGNNTCRGQKRELNGSVLLEYIADVNFESPTGNIVSFDRYGNPSKSADDIVNYQAVDINGVKQYRFEIVGRWYHQTSDSNNITEALQLNNNVTLQFGISKSTEIRLDPPVSTCRQCVHGEYRIVVQFSCCSLCQPCLGSNYSDESDTTSCKNCSLTMPGEMWGNNPLNGSNACIQIPETRLDFSNPLSIVNVVISSLGMIFTTVAAVVFSIFWNTPFIKASGREQMVLILSGVASSFISAIIYVSPPSIGVCVLQRFGLWFSFSLMFGALLMKVTRVARIFLAKWPTRLRFATPRYQILFTLLIVSVQVVLVGISIAQTLPNVSRVLRMNSRNTLDTPTVVVICNTDPLASFILSIFYESILILIATALGVLSFKYPANFNEAKFIAFCAFALVIWTAFIPPYVYFTTQPMQEYQSATISLAVNLSALSLLACMFGPKIYLVTFHPDKNTKRRVNDTSCNSKLQSTQAGSEISIDATKANTLTKIQL